MFYWSDQSYCVHLKVKITVGRQCLKTHVLYVILVKWQLTVLNATEGQKYAT